MPKKYRWPSNIGLVVLVVLTMAALFGLTTVFAASGSGLLGRRIDIEATAQAIRFEHRRAELQATADFRLAALEIQIQGARRSLEIMRQTVQAQSAAQTNQLTAIRQEVQRKQAAVKEMESKLMEAQLALKADEESLAANPVAPPPAQEQLKTELLRQLRAVETQLAAAQAQLQARFTATPAVVDDRQQDSDSEKPDDDHDHDHDDDDDDDHHDKVEEDKEHDEVDK